MMRANRVREIWQSGGAVINCWCGIPSGFSAEIMAHMGWDSLVVDTQHGIVGYESMVAMLQGISTTAVTPMVRVPWNNPADIMKALDAGAYGIICPMINSRAECEAFVGACRYAPRGYRSSGPIRATLYGGPDYHAKANDVVVAMAMIETTQALENLDGTLARPRQDRGGRHRGIQEDPRGLHAQRRPPRHSYRQRRLRQADDRDGLPVRHAARRRPPADDGGTAGRPGDARRRRQT